MFLTPYSKSVQVTTLKINPSSPYVVWHLLVQFEIDHFSSTQTFLKSWKCLLLALKWKMAQVTAPRINTSRPLEECHTAVQFHLLVLSQVIRQISENSCFSAPFWSLIPKPFKITTLKNNPRLHSVKWHLVL